MVVLDEGSQDLAGAKALILTTFRGGRVHLRGAALWCQRFPRQALPAGRANRRDPHRRPRRRPALPAASRALIARFLAQHDPGPATAPGLLDALTDRERETVTLVATGMSNAEIAEHLGLSPLTVKTHANHAMTKLGARDHAQLVVLACQACPAGKPSA